MRCRLRINIHILRMYAEPHRFFSSTTLTISEACMNLSLQALTTATSARSECMDNNLKWILFQHLATRNFVNFSPSPLKVSLIINSHHRRRRYLLLRALTTVSAVAANVLVDRHQHLQPLWWLHSVGQDVSLNDTWYQGIGLLYPCCNDTQRSLCRLKHRLLEAITRTRVRMYVVYYDRLRASSILLASCLFLVTGHPTKQCHSIYIWCPIICIGFSRARFAMCLFVSYSTTIQLVLLIVVVGVLCAFCAF